MLQNPPQPRTPTHLSSPPMVPCSHEPPAHHRTGTPSPCAHCLIQHRRVPLHERRRPSPLPSVARIAVVRRAACEGGGFRLTLNRGRWGRVPCWSLHALRVLLPSLLTGERGVAFPHPLLALLPQEAGCYGRIGSVGAVSRLSRPKVT